MPQLESHPSANKGYHPNISIHPEQNLALTRAHDFAVDLYELHQELHKTISEAQQRYSMSADHRQTLPPEFKIGDKVFVKSDNIQTTRPSKKLSEKYLGPFEIIAQVGSVSFTLRLPDNMRAIHPVFHVSMLEPSTPNDFPNRVTPPQPPIIIDGKSEREISKILDSKIDKRWKCQLQYLFKWSGYECTEDEASWLPASELGNGLEVVSDFHQAYPHKPGPLPLAQHST